MNPQQDDTIIRYDNEEIYVTDSDTTEVELSARERELHEEIVKLTTERDLYQRQLAHARRGYVSKAIVKEAIAYGTTRFGFCSEVNRLDQRFGLTTPDKIRLKVDLGVYGTAEVDLECGEYEQLQEAQQLHDYLSNKLKIGVSYNGQSNGPGISPTVNGIEEVGLVADLVTPEAIPEGTFTPDGYQWRFTSLDGRVRHLVGTNANSSTGSAVCGARASYNWQRTSNRSEDRNCTGCAQWAERIRP